MISQAMAKLMEHWPLNRLIPYARNPGTHSDAQVAQTAASIEAFGFNNPILVDTNAGIIAGHGRLLAARKLGLKEVPVIVLDHLSEKAKTRIHPGRQSARTQRWMGRRTVAVGARGAAGGGLRYQPDRLCGSGARATARRAGRS